MTHLDVYDYSEWTTKMKSLNTSTVQFIRYFGNDWEFDRLWKFCSDHQEKGKISDVRGKVFRLRKTSWFSIDKLLKLILSLTLTLINFSAMIWSEVSFELWKSLLRKFHDFFFLSWLFWFPLKFEKFSSQHILGGGRLRVHPWTCRPKKQQILQKFLVCFQQRENNFSHSIPWHMCDLA